MMMNGTMPRRKEARRLDGKEDERLSWKETFKAMAHEHEDWAELDATLSDGLDKETQ